MLKLGNRTKRSLLYGAASIIALMLLFPFVTELCLNSAPFKREIADRAHQKTGIQIDPDKIKFQIKIARLLPMLSIGIKDTPFFLNDGLSIQVKAAYVELDTLGLIRGKIIPRGIRVDTPKLQFISRPPQEAKPDKKQIAEPSWFEDIDLSEKEIQRLFAFLPDDSDEIELALSNLKSEYFKSVNGIFSVSRSAQTLTLDLNGQVAKIPESRILEIPVLNSMHIQSMGFETIRLSCALSASNGISGNVKLGNFSMESDQLSGKRILVEQAMADFHISNKSWSFQLKPFALAYPQGRAGMTFSHDPVSGKSSIAFTGSEIQIKEARQVCLALGRDSRFITRLFDILRNGKVEEIGISFKNDTLQDLFDAHSMVLKGSVQQGSVKIPETSLLVHGIQGRAFIQKGLLQISSQSGSIYGSKIEKGWLELDLLNHDDVPFKGEFNLHADLSGVPATLISIMPGTRLAEELKKIDKIEGEAEVRLILNMETGDSDPRVRVFAQNIAAKGRYKRIPLPLEINQGKFTYTSERITLDELSGKINDNPIEDLSAMIETSDRFQFSLQSARASLKTGDFMDWIQSTPWIMERIEPVKNLSGLVNIENLNITGPFFHPEEWTFLAKGFSRGMDLGFSSPRAIRNLSGEFSFTDKEVHVSALRAKVHDLGWLSGSIDSRKLDSIRTPLDAVLKNIDLKSGENRISGTILFPSGAGLDFVLSGKSLELLKPQTLVLRDGELTRAEIGFSYDPVSPLFDFKGFVNTRTFDNILQKDSFLYKTVHAFTGGNPIRIYTDKVSTLHLDIGHLNLDPLIQKNGPRKNKSERQPLIFPKTAQIKAESLGYKNLNFTNLKADVSSGKKGKSIQILNLDLCDLESSGTASLTGTPDQTLVEMDVKIRSGERENILPMLSCIFKDTRLIEGPYSFSCDLNGKGPLDNFTKTLTGKLSFQSQNGRIYKATLLSRILSVINILSLPDLEQEGFAYDSFDVQGKIKDGVIHLEKAVIDGENMAMTFTGWISPFENKMDLTCLVAPFKTIDTIIKYIPVINTALQGRLVSFPAKVQGPLNDPVVTPLHPSAVGEGLINMMGDILKTPIRLLKGTP
ncbi:DUF3971 domain-containing protein [Desulfospira joergensenii]|uniref:DUF3971 domain-containing protein n=1 Tax=Desulfospira joergensenii TaxID=53329 RepID=UPI000426F654|nr:DUF3971 domain-containing protein [Desulfospira joergensenii]